MVKYYHTQYQKKLMIQSWENLVMDKQIDRQADRQMDKSDFIGHYPINVEHLKTSYFYSYTYEKMLFWYETL